MIALFPSLIAGNLLNLEKEISLLNPVSDGYHLDVMDFHFVPNLTWGPAFINAIAQATPLPVYVHLMVDDPEKYFDRFILRTGDTIAFHIESCLTTPVACNIKTGSICPSLIDYTYIQELITMLHQQNIRVGIAFNPSTTLDALIPIASIIDDFLLMSVKPGFSGQEFLPGSLGRLEQVKTIKQRTQASFTITMDGGINATNITQIAQHGVDACSIATGIFNIDNPVQAIQLLKNTLSKST